MLGKQTLYPNSGNELQLKYDSSQDVDCQCEATGK